MQPESQGKMIQNFTTINFVIIDAYCIATNSAFPNIIDFGILYPLTLLLLLRLMILRTLYLLYFT